MGQYFKAVLVGNEWQLQVVRPDWRKLMEHSFYGSRTMKFIERILYREARNVMRVWDYSIASSLVWKHEVEDEIELNYDADFPPELFLKRDTDLDYFLINKYSYEFINMTRQETNKDLIDSYWDVVHPLPLLTRFETEEAWWWYHSDIGREYIWKRCWDIISIWAWKREEYEKALKDNWYKDMTDVYFFKEEY